jgi:hypothetical protein
MIGILHIVCLFALGAFAAIQTSSPSLNKALEAQIALVQQDPSSVNALNDLGNLLELAQRPAEAEAAYRRAIELGGHEALPRFNLGLLLQQAGQQQAALEEFSRVVELEPDHAWGHYQVGALYEAQGLKDKAVAAYARAFALDYDLTRPSVNPHIIENNLVVEAMLKAYREVAVRPLAPKRYEDASRIVGLMVNEPPLPNVESEPEEGDDWAASAAEGGQGEISSGERSAATAAADDDEDGDSGGEARETANGRVLNQDTLRDNPAPRNEIEHLGGVFVGGGSGRGSVGGTGNRQAPSNRRLDPAGVRQGRSNPRNGSTVVPRNNTRDTSTSTGAGATPRRPTTPTRTRRGPGFIPSTGSTGRLDWQLRPAPPRGPEPAG